MRATEHKVTIRKIRPHYKWRGACTCGWGCLSWSWSREYDAATSGLERAHWVRENGEPDGGALPMALEHLGTR